jgi:hypothetical protein
VQDCYGIADKCLGLIEGNHEYENRRRHYVDIVRDACRELHAPYLGHSALVRVVFHRKDENDAHVCSDNWIIYAEHGAGGGRLPGAKLNGLKAKVSDVQADVYLRGHVHEKAALKTPVLSMTLRGKPKLTARTRVLALTGCYYRTYEQDTSSYGEIKSFPPTELGGVRIRIRPMTGEVETVE